jgi:hypothetical protein
MPVWMLLPSVRCMCKSTSISCSAAGSSACCIAACLPSHLRASTHCAHSLERSQALHVLPSVNKPALWQPHVHPPPHTHTHHTHHHTLVTEHVADPLLVAEGWPCFRVSATGESVSRILAASSLPPLPRALGCCQVSSMWEDYCSQMLLIRSIFLYLDRTYVMSLPGLRSLVDTGLLSLRQHLAAHPKVGRWCVSAEGCGHLPVVVFMFEEGGRGEEGGGEEGRCCTEPQAIV